MRRAIIYHANCNDGITAAAIALTRLEMQYPGRHEQTGVFACNYGYDFPKEIPLDCEEVFILDFSFPPEVMHEVAERMPATSFWVIDHHASAIEKYEGYEMQDNVHLEFDTGPGISGASLAWKHFFPQSEAPDIVLDVADRDTWVFSRPNTKAIHQALLNLDSRTPERVSDFIMDTTDGQIDSYEKLVSLGTTLLDSYNKNLAEIHQTAFYRSYKKMGPFENLRVVLVNCPYHFISDMAEYIREHDDRYTEDMLFIGFVVRKNGVSLSFRSEQGIAKPVAEHYGGGGHLNSSGANVTYGILIDLLTQGERISDLGFRSHYLVVPEYAFLETGLAIKVPVENVDIEGIRHLLFSLEYAKGRPLREHRKLVDQASYIFYFEDKALHSEKIRNSDYVKEVAERVRAYASNSSKS